MSEQTDSSLLSHYVFLCDVPSAKSICPHLQLNWILILVEMIRIFPLLHFLFVDIPSSWTSINQ